MGIKLLVVAKSIDGGTGTFVNSILRLKGNGLEITPLVLEKPSYRPVRRGKFRYFKSKDSYPQDYKASVKNIYSFIKEFFWIKTMIKKEKPALLFGIDMHANLLLCMNKHFFYPDTPLILTTHTGIKETLLEKASPVVSFLVKSFLSFFYQKANNHICVSKHIATSISRTLRLKSNPGVIYNGVKTKKLSITTLKKGSPVFINIARLTKQKDHKTLIKAFAKVNKKLPKSKLLIVGEGPEKRSLVEFSKKLQISGVDFVGWQKDPSKALSRANIFVLSSNREGLPFSLIEALSHSKAIVSTKTPHGPKEVLGKDEYGLLVPVGNAKKLAEAMLKVGNREKTYKKFAKRAHQRSRDFDENKMLESYRKVINESTH